MSDALYSTRLRWQEGRGGIAKLYGRSVRFDGPFDLGAGPVHMLDYVPELGMREIRRRSIDTLDVMSDAETAAADALLRRIDP